MEMSQHPWLFSRANQISPLTVAGKETEPAIANTHFDAKAVFLRDLVRFLTDNESGRVFDLDHFTSPLSGAVLLPERLSLPGKAKVQFEKTPEERSLS